MKNTDVFRRWLYLLGLLAARGEPMLRVDAARALRCSERTLRRDVAAINELAGSAPQGLPFVWPRIEVERGDEEDGAGRATMRLAAESPAVETRHDGVLRPLFGRRQAGGSG